MPRILTQAELTRLAESLGIDAIGAAPAEPYDETEQHIRDRRQRGLFADMRFTMSKPEVSCHPERLFPEARTVVSAALGYYAPAADPQPGEGKLPRYTWSHAYAALRERLEELGRQLGGRHRVLVDENQHVDREGAARAGVGFYGKNTLLITRRYGSWVVLGTLVTEAEIESSAALDLNCGSCRLCIDACPTGALDEPGVLDSTLCLSYWTQAPGSIPEGFRAELGNQVYGCDICQDVCPWNRGIEKRRSDADVPETAEPVVSLADWLEAPDDELRERYDRLYFPKNDPRYLRRNALVAAGNSGDARLVPLVRRYADSEDELLREHAAWAAERLAGPA
jgi:epoxyqueuosine reductase